MAEETKVNVNEDGTPINPGEEGYLYAGKYKTVEEMEKGVKEGEKKITELGQGKSSSDQAVKELSDLIKQRDVKAPAGDEKKRLEDEEVTKQATALRDAWEKGPVDALNFFKGLIEKKSGGFMKKTDFDKKSEEDEASAAIYNKARGTGDPEKKEQAKEFDALKPVMKEIWGKLPKASRVPEMIETVFLAAKAKASPDLKAKLIADLRAAHTGKEAGAGGEGEAKSKDDKYIEEVVKEHQKTQGKL